MEIATLNGQPIRHHDLDQLSLGDLIGIEDAMRVVRATHASRGGTRDEETIKASLRRALRRGTLDGLKLGGVWLTTEAAIERWLD